MDYEVGDIVTLVENCGNPICSICEFINNNNPYEIIGNTQGEYIVKSLVNSFTTNTNKKSIGVICNSTIDDWL